jgi:catalase
MPIGRMVLDRNPSNYFAEVEQVAFGTGVLVDGMDFSDDKLLQGRTFSYSDAQRHRVGTNYLQLPVNQPKTPVHTNQRDGQMAQYQDSLQSQGVNPSVNYEPSKHVAPREVKPQYPAHTPTVSGRVVRQEISRPNNYGQAGERYRSFEKWEREELINNLVGALSQCDADIQQRMVDHLRQCDADYGQRVADGLGLKKA